MPASHDNVLYASALLRVGEFDCPIDAPDFANTGPIDGYLLAYPRTAVKIRHTDKRDIIVADTNTVTIYNKGQEYERYALSRYGDRCDWIALCPELLCEILADLGISQRGESEYIFDVTHGFSSARLYLQVRTLVNELHQDPLACSLKMDEVGLGLFRDTLRQVFNNSGEGKSNAKFLRTSAKHRRLVKGVSEFLASCFTEQISLARISKTLNSSPYHLSRIFREHTGTSIHRYLMQLRLRAAMQSVEDTNIDLSTLGVALGFSDHSHFSSSFRRAFGVAPSEFRHRSSFV